MRYTNFVFLLAATASSEAARATPFCVDTSQKLRDALVTALNNGQPNNLIKIVRGSYSTGGTTFSYNASSSVGDGNLIVRGGYNADCSTQIANPALTVLDAMGQSAVLSVVGNSGAITVQYLTIQNGTSPSALNVGSTTADATASANIVRNNHSNAFLGAALSVSAGGTIHVDNNLVYGNIVDDGNGTVEIISAGGDSFVTNNTVTGNTSTSTAVGGVYFSYFFTSATPAAYFSNNIFWNNTSYGLFVDGAAAMHSHLARNDIGNANVGTSCCLNVSVAPQFVDKNAGNFRLGTASPLLGTGTTAPPGGLPLTDLDGNPRFFNGLVDPGAYEFGDVIFVDGLDY